MSIKLSFCHFWHFEFLTRRESLISGQGKETAQFFKRNPIFFLFSVKYINPYNYSSALLCKYIKNTAVPNMVYTTLSGISCHFRSFLEQFPPNSRTITLVIVRQDRSNCSTFRKKCFDKTLDVFLRGIYQTELTKIPRKQNARHEYSFDFESAIILSKWHPFTFLWITNTMGL